MNFKTFLIGLLILLVTPLLVVGGFWAYTHWHNQQPQKGLLQCAVAPEMVWTEEPTTYTMTFLGDTLSRPANLPLKPLDMIFVVDVSPSMGQIFPDMATAAQTVAKNMQPNNVRFALISFHQDADIKVSWTTDPNALYKGLSELQVVSGSGTDGRSVFPYLDELLTAAQPDANKVIVFYTDGIIFQDDKLHTSPSLGHSPSEGDIHSSEDHSIADNAEALRNQDIKIFVLMPPQSQGFDAADSMVLLTGDSNQVFRLEGRQNLEHQLEKRFQAVAETAIGTYAGGADIEHRLDGKNFSVPNQNTVGEINSTWQIENPAGATQPVAVFKQHLCYLPFKRDDYKHTLIPHSTGLWEVGLAPPEMVYTSLQNQTQTEKCERRPLLLVLSPWLFLFWLPALFWLLYYVFQLLRKITVAKREYLAPPIYPMSSPAPLPAPVLPPTRSILVPTLFIGLGGTGRQALYTIRNTLAHHADNTSALGPQIRFLWLDVGVGEQESKMPFMEAENLIPIREMVAPMTIRQVAQYLPTVQQPLPDHLTWFNPQEYLDAPRATLDLSRGSGGRRALARLALFQWLSTSSELGNVLKEEMEALLKYESVDGQRQIVLLADRAGGVGSGWMIDIARLLRRLTRPTILETPTVLENLRNLVSEIVGVLCGNSGSRPTLQQQRNSQALLKELETAQKVGAFPQRVAYSNGTDDWLDRVDHESPFNWLFSVSGSSLEEMAMQSAELSAVLVERLPRWTLLHHRLNQGQLLSAQANSVRVMPLWNYQWVKHEILWQILGPEVLLDLQPTTAAKTQWEVVSLSENQVEKLLSQWVASEPKGTPWQLLLNATLNQDSLRLLLTIVAERGHPERVWFQRAFVDSLSRQLRGSRATGRWLPGEAVAVLRLLANRLETQVKPAATGKLADILVYVAELAKQAATQLQRWLEEFIPLCEKLGERQQALLQQSEFFKAVKSQMYLDKMYLDKNLNSPQSVQKALQGWVGSVEVTAVLGEHLFFAARAEQETLAITLLLYVEERQEFFSVAPAVATLERYADHATQQVPTLRIAGALAASQEAPVKELAKTLVNAERQTEQVLMMMPNVSREAETAREAMRRFRQAMPEPTGQVLPDHCVGEDLSVVRRLEVYQTELPDAEMMMDNLPFVQTAEQIADKIRQQAERQFEMQIPIFPPALRLALSQPVAFRSFGRAYQTGHIVRKQDLMGVTQWWYSDTGEFLTFRRDNSLAVAAANYVYLVKSLPETFQVGETPGDFSKLELWKRNGGVPSAEVSVLIAIQVVEATDRN